MPEIREITRVQEERRLITVLFADLVGFTSLAERLDPEESRDLARSLLNQLGNIVRVNGGYVDKFLGDGLIALFGAPTAHEDDPQRAIQSALSMQALVKEYPGSYSAQIREPLHLRIGINTGEAVVGDFAESGKSDYTAIGDTVNTAQRLETIAQPGQIIVARTTQQLTAAYFLFRQLPAVQLKGKQAYVQPYEVLKAITKPVLFTTPFVNRVNEITRLKNILGRVIEERVPGAVILYGEPGIGKSRLLWEFRKYLADSPHLIRGLSARCYSVLRKPYGLLNQIISSLAAIGANDAPAETQAKLKGYAQEVLPDELLAHHFLGLFLGIRYPDLPDGKAGSPLEQIGAKDAELTGFIILKRLFEVQTLKYSALVIILDDLHWADEGSLRFLRLFSQVKLNSAIMIIALSRPFEFIEEMNQPLWEKVSLEHLAEKDTSKFINEALLKGKPLPAGLAAQIQSRTQGNPLFLEELLKNLFEQKYLVETEQGVISARAISEIPLPMSLWQLLEARLDLISETQREVLQCAAVLGDKFNYQTLTSLVARPIENEISGLIEKGLIIETEVGEYEFKHTLIQETAYKMLTKKERKRYHQNALEYFKTRLDLKENQTLSYYNQLGRHSELSEKLDEAIEYYEKGAGVAKEKYANDEAIRLYTRVIELSSRKGKESFDSLFQRAEIYSLIGKLEEALNDYEKLCSLARQQNNKEIEIKTLNGLGKVMNVKGDYPGALKVYKEALATAQERGDRQSIGICLGNIGTVRMNQGDYSGALKSLEDSLTIAREIGNRQRIGSCLGNIGLVRWGQGDYSGALKAFEGALTIAREMEDRQMIGTCLGNIGGVRSRQGDYSGALKGYEEFLTIARETGDRQRVGQCLGNIGTVRLSQSDYSGALKTYEEALAIAREIGNRRGVGLWLGNIGNVRCSQGDYSGALEVYEESLTIAREVGDRENIGLWLNSIGMIQQRLGNYPGALETHHQALKILEEIGYKEGKVQTLLGLVLDYINQSEAKGSIAADELVQAEGFIQEAGRLSEEIKNQPLITSVLVIRSRFLIAQDRSKEAVLLLEQALERTKTTGEKPLYAEVLYLMGRATTGEQARAYLEQARTLAAELGYQPLLQEIQTCPVIKEHK